MKLNLKLLFTTVTVISLAQSVWCTPAVADEIEETAAVPAEHRTGRKDSGVQQEGRVWRIPLVKKKLLLLKFKKLLPLTTLPLLLLRNGEGGGSQLVSVVPVDGSSNLQSILPSTGQSGSQTYAIPSDLLQEQVVEVAADSQMDSEEEEFDGNPEVIEIGGESEKPIATNAAKKISSYSGLSGLTGLPGLSGLSELAGHPALAQAFNGRTPIIIYAVPQQVEYGRAAGHSNKVRRRLLTRF